MKKIVIFILLGMFGFGFSQSTAVDYMNAINSGNQKILVETWDYLTAVARQKSARKIEKRRKEVEVSIRESLRNVSMQKAFNGNSAYKDASVAYLNFNLDLMTGKVAKLVDMEEISNQSYDAMEAYILYQRELNKISDEQNKIVRKAQEQFAAANNINLIDGKNELAEKVLKGNEILQYKEDIFLVFARCSMYEQAMLQSMQKDSHYDYAQAGVTLLELTEVSKSVMDTITEINYDKSLRQQTQRALDFYKQEAEVLLPAFQENTKMQNDFKVFSEAFEKMSNKEKTQAKVNEYNTQVKQLNASVTKFNTTLNLYNEKRSKMFEMWNTIADSFVEKHMPR